jgi:hypothetical protein
VQDQFTVRETGRSRRWGRHVLTPVLLGALSATGCAGWWDQVTSRDYKLGQMFRPTDPLVTLRDSTDGDARARALRSLKEPRRRGGTEEQQNLHVEVLCRAASTERHALCRLAAIHALRDYRDPRVVDGLKEAYYRAGSFNPETATVIRCAALEAIGNTGQPAGIETLVKVLREPPVEGAEIERQLKADERIAAARALAHFKDPEAQAALVGVMKTDKDVALRSRAHESLMLSTGKRMPMDAKVWDDYFRDPVATEQALAASRTWKQHLLEIVPVAWYR